MSERRPDGAATEAILRVPGGAVTPGRAVVEVPTER